LLKACRYSMYIQQQLRSDWSLTSQILMVRRLFVNWMADSHKIQLLGPCSAPVHYIIKQENKAHALI
jgi:hypothetical protein